MGEEAFFISLVIWVLNKKGILIPTPVALVITVAVTTLCWMITAFIGPQTDRRTLIQFYRKVRPFGPGWRQVRLEAGITEAEAQATHENVPLALLGWVAGCTVIWSGLFMVGNFLYGRMLAAGFLLALLVMGGIVLVRVINKLWSGGAKPVPVTALASAPDAIAKRD